MAWKYFIGRIDIIPCYLALWPISSLRLFDGCEYHATIRPRVLAIDQGWFVSQTAVKPKLL